MSLSNTAESFDVLIDGLELCIKALPEAVTVLNKCNEVECSVPQYVALRRNLNSEIIMYSRHVYPQSIALVKSVKDMLNKFDEYSDDEFLEDINYIIKDCEKYQRKATVAQEENKMELVRLGKLKEKMLRQEAEFGTSANAAEKRAESRSEKGIGFWCVGAASYGVALLASGPLGVGALIASNVFSYSSIAMSIGSIKDSSRAAEFTVAAAATATLVDSLNRVSAVVESVKNFLGILADEMEDIGDRNRAREARSYLRYFKRKHDEAVTLCEAFIEGQGEWEEVVRSIRHDVDNDFKLEWLKERRNLITEN